MNLNILSWTGPLWFVLALLIFSLIYVALKPLFNKLVTKYAFKINIKNVLILILLISTFAFIIRLKFPIGSAVMNMALEFFSAYIFMFAIGIIAFHKKLFDKISYRSGKKWLLCAFGIGVPVWIVCITIYRATGLGFGGMNIMSYIMAIWESFFCVTIIIALIGIFRHLFNSQNRLQKFLSTNSFGVYVFHPPILIGTSVLLKGLALPPLFKWIIVAAIVVCVTYIVVWLIKLVPLFRKIFA